MQAKKNRTVLSMFSGCGGVDLGFQKAGFKIVWANDVNSDACKTYRKNIGEIYEGDIRQIDPPDLQDLDVLTAGFPCQPFSNAGNRFGLEDDRGTLYHYCLNFIDKLQPKIVMFENVRGFLSIKGQNGGLLIDEICEGLSSRGYEIHFKLINAVDYGVPQNRIRIIIVGISTKDNLGKFGFPNPIKGLDLALKNYIDVPDDAPNQNDLLRLNPQAVYLGSLVPEGGSWKDIPYELLPERLKKIRDDMARYRWPKFYRKFSRDEISGTITAAFKPENAGVWHPIKNRVFSAREIARIQSFPDDFVFEAKSVKAIYEMIGNAVPPKVAFAFAEVFKQILCGQDYYSSGPISHVTSVERIKTPIRPNSPEIIWNRSGNYALYGTGNQEQLPFTSATN